MNAGSIMADVYLLEQLKTQNLPFNVFQILDFNNYIANLLIMVKSLDKL